MLNYKTISSVLVFICILYVTSIYSIAGQSFIDLPFVNKLYGEGEYYQNRNGLYNKSGKWVYYYDKTKKYKAAEVEYYNKEQYVKMNPSSLPNGFSMVNGKFVSYYDKTNRKYIDGEYSVGQRDGYWTVYSKDGQVVAEGSYNVGVRNGNYRYYFEDGKVCDIQYDERGGVKFIRGVCGGAKHYIDEFPLIP